MSAEPTANASVSAPAAGDRGNRRRLRPWIALRAVLREYWRVRAPLARRRLPLFAATGVVVVVFAQFFIVGWVWSASVKPFLAFVVKGQTAAVGKMLAYRYPGNQVGDYRKGDPLVHLVVGGPGSRITREGRMVFVDGKPIGVAKTTSYLGESLEPIEPGIIPPGHFFVMGTHPDALDSRYSAAGLVTAADVIGRAYVIF